MRSVIRTRYEVLRRQKRKAATREEKTLVTLLLLVQDTKRLVENEVTHQILVDAGAELGVEREKGVGLDIVARRVRMKKK